MSNPTPQAAIAKDAADALAIAIEHCSLCRGYGRECSEHGTHEDATPATSRTPLPWWAQ